MQTIIAAILLLAFAMAALALGVVFGRPPIKGSCGGLACNGACSSCKRDRAASEP